jgi:uncharacterized protein
MKVRERSRILAVTPLVFLAGCGGGVRMERLPAPGDVVALEIQGKTIEAELANDPTSREVGLMFRKELPENLGMLFIWTDHSARNDRPEAGPQRRYFWMRNTSIPLSIAFIDDDGKILQIEDMRPHDERRVWSKDVVRFALEVNQGWFHKNGIEPGAVIADFKKKVGRIEAQ